MTAFGSHSGQDSFNVPTDLGCASTPQDSQPDALCPCDDFLGVGDLLKGSDARKKKWLQFRRQASNGFVGLPNQLVDSKAFAALTTGASVKTLVWFWGEAKYEKKKRKPGTESPIGKIDKIKNNGEISFTYQVAEWRGLKPRTFYRVLRELHRVGFIDVSRQGRGRKGEYTKYALSSRWQWYNTPEWKEIPFPEGFKEGFRSSEFQENQRKRREKSSGQKSPLPMDNKVPYEIGEALKSGQKSPLKMAVTSHSQRTKKSISIDSVMGCTTSKMNKKKVQTRNSRSKGTAAATSTNQWRPPLSEIRENVAEILRQRPDPRADDPQFVRLISGQLGEALAGRLDPGRVHLDLQARHDLDGWTTDLLFTIATINLNFRGATN